MALRVALPLILCGAIPFGVRASEPLSPAEALNRFLARPAGAASECAGRRFAVQLDAALPRLRKQGSMTGFKVVNGKLPAGKLKEGVKAGYPSRAIRWVLKQAANGFRGTTGSFDE